MLILYSNLPLDQSMRKKNASFYDTYSTLVNWKLVRGS